jgi:hypothetical protein
MRSRLPLGVRPALVAGGVVAACLLAFLVGLGLLGGKS